jgi:predicted Zn-dependent peptidase
MNNVTIEDIVQHYKSTHSTSNMRFVIAGKITATRRRYIRDTLSKMALPKGRGRKELPNEIPKPLADPLTIRNKTVDNYYFYFDTFLRRRMDDDELAAMSLLNSMLTETLYSRILGTARERGLVYSMSSGVGYDLNSTNWWFGAQVRPDNAHALFDIMVSQLREIFDGKLTKEELDAAKQRRLGGYQRGYQTVSGIAGYYAGSFFFDDRFIDYHSLPERIKSVTKTQIIRGARELFEEKVWGLGVLGNPQKGEVTELKHQLEEIWG